MERDQLNELYQKGFNASTYLDLYNNEAMLCVDDFISTHLFKVFDQGKAKGKRCIDVGAGPLVHRLSYASRVFEEVVSSDFTDSNRDTVNRWLTTNEMDQHHREKFKFNAKLEGYTNEEEGAKLIETRLRSRLKSVIPIDILNSNPVGDLSLHGGPFDCAISCACLESACSSYEQLVTAAKNIGTLLKPGAAFCLTGYVNGDYYKVGPTRFPCLRWDGDMAQKGLEEAGYRVEFLELLELPADSVPATTPDIEAESNCETAFFSLSYKI